MGVAYVERMVALRIKVANKTCIFSCSVCSFVESILF